MVLPLVAATRTVSVLLSLRLLPFAVYAALRPRTGLRQRLTWGMAYLAFPAIAWKLGAWWSLFLVLTGSIWYLALGCGVNHLSRWMATGRVTRGAATVGILFFCLLLPGVLLPGVAMAAFLVLGWELALSSYSYCVETSRPGCTRASLGDCLFFLLVNPTVVYTARGVPVDDEQSFPGLWRTIAGGIVIFADIAVLGPVCAYLRHGSALNSLPAGAALTVIAYGVMRFLELYGAHSGLASLQIGLVRQAGWIVPERYLYPAFSTSPMDFWRRWNTYVRIWLEAYVFFPLAKRIARKTRRRSGQMVAAVATLGASGLIHGAFVFAGRQTLDGLQVGLFLAAGVLLAIWQLAASFGALIRRQLEGAQRGAFDRVTTMLARVGIAAAVIGAAVEWGG
jgi:hypothetical protein